MPDFYADNGYMAGGTTMLSGLASGATAGMTNALSLYGAIQQLKNTAQDRDYALGAKNEAFANKQVQDAIAAGQPSTAADAMSAKTLAQQSQGINTVGPNIGPPPKPLSGLSDLSDPMYANDPALRQSASDLNDAQAASHKLANSQYLDQAGYFSGMRDTAKPDLKLGDRIIQREEGPSGDTVKSLTSMMGLDPKERAILDHDANKQDALFKHDDTKAEADRQTRLDVAKIRSNGGRGAGAGSTVPVYNVQEWQKDRSKFINDGIKAHGTTFDEEAGGRDAIINRLGRQFDRDNPKPTTQDERQSVAPKVSASSGAYEAPSNLVFQGDRKNLDALDDGTRQVITEAASLNPNWKVVITPNGAGRTQKEKDAITAQGLKPAANGWHDIDASGKAHGVDLNIVDEKGQVVTPGNSQTLAAAASVWKSRSKEFIVYADGHIHVGGSDATSSPSAVRPPAIPAPPKISPASQSMLDRERKAMADKQAKADAKRTKMTGG